MGRKGYKPALEQAIELTNVVNDVNAYSELIPEMLERIDAVATSRLVTRAELRRDYGFTASDLSLLERWNVLSPQRSGARRMYDLARALRLKVLAPCFLGTRRVRSRKRINTILHDLLEKRVAPNHGDPLASRERAGAKLLDVIQ